MRRRAEHSTRTGWVYSGCATAEANHQLLYFSEGTTRALQIMTVTLIGIRLVDADQQPLLPSSGHLKLVDTEGACEKYNASGDSKGDDSTCHAGHLPSGRHP